MEKPFKVIIVGGSIAGLSLAHCLDRAGIDYVVLDRQLDLAPQLGASIGIMPNGARILDQLGLFDAVEAEIEALERSHIYLPDGFGHTSFFPKILHDRFGYPLAFLDRQKFLAIVYDGLKNKDRVHVGKEVIKIEHSEDGVRVATKDGSHYDGDLVVGADGVHSRVRSEMWRIADEQRPGLISVKEKNSPSYPYNLQHPIPLPSSRIYSPELSSPGMKAEYICVYGVSSAIPGMEAGEAITCFYDKLTFLTFHGKGGRIFWFVITKSAEPYVWPNIPRFTRRDGEELCESVRHLRVYKHVDFGHVWAQRETYSMTALEENVFEHWHFGRVVCLGDSMHKMTPNFGQGANSAIESATVLANALHELIHLRRTHRPSSAQLSSLLEGVRKARRARTKSIVKTAGFVTRLQARDGPLNVFIGRYLVPYAPDYPASIAGGIIVGGEMLDFLPVPARSESSWPRPSGFKGLIGGIRKGYGSKRLGDGEGSRADDSKWRQHAWRVLAVLVLMLATVMIRTFFDLSGWSVDRAMVGVGKGERTLF